MQFTNSKEESDMKVSIISELSIDGKMTVNQGQTSRSLLEMLSDEELKYLHSFRQNADAIMVGKNTLCIDNPQLTARYGFNKKLLRIVPSSTLNLSLDLKIFIDENPTLIVAPKKQKDNPKVKEIKALGKECLLIGQDKVDFKELFEVLQNNRINNIIVEGGGILNWQLLRDGLVDEIVIIQIPIIVGGCNVTSFAEGKKEEGFIVKGFNLVNFKKFKNMFVATYKKD